jgi:hypothetical protein
MLRPPFVFAFMVALFNFQYFGHAQIELIRAKQPTCTFGDGERNIETIWRNPTGDLANFSLRARLYQASSATAAPFSQSSARKFEIPPRETILDSTLIQLPPVTAKTKFVIQWVNETDKMLGTTEVFAYPVVLLSDLKPLAAGGPVGVYDPEQQLKPLLRNASLQISDLEEAGLDHFQGKLAILGPFKSKSQMRDGFKENVQALARRGKAVVWLQPPSPSCDSRSPSYFMIPAATGTIIIAQSDLIEGLRESPRSQLNLIQLATLAVRPEQQHLPSFAFDQ